MDRRERASFAELENRRDKAVAALLNPSSGSRYQIPRVLLESVVAFTQTNLDRYAREKATSK